MSIDEQLTKIYDDILSLERIKHDNSKASTFAIVSGISAADIIHQISLLETGMDNVDYKLKETMNLLIEYAETNDEHWLGAARGSAGGLLGAYHTYLGIRRMLISEKVPRSDAT